MKTDMNHIEAISVQSNFISDIVYRTVDDVELKLDLVVPGMRLGEPPWWVNDGKKKPTLLYIHGGAWVEGKKEEVFLELLPFVARNWVVVNVEYRLAHEVTNQHEPAPIIDCRKALSWIYDHSDEYMMDTDQIVLAGESAGSHLAMMTSFLQPGDIIYGGFLALLTGLSQQEQTLYGTPYTIEHSKKVAAVINWFGTTDFLAMEQVDSEQPVELDATTMEAIGNIFRSVSPVNYVRPGSPPVITIHGTTDPIVNFNQATILHDKLQKTGIPNKLIAIEGKKHGNFSSEEKTMIFQEIWTFLEANGIHS